MLYQIFFIKIKILSLGITKQKENKISRTHVKNVSTYLVIREKQIKTIIRFI